MGHNDEKIDDDILKAKENILRARKAASRNRQPSNKDSDKSVSSSDSVKGSEKKPAQNIPLEPSPMMKAVVDANKQKSTDREAPDVPKFDVARKILAQQRKVAAAKRTAPVKAQPDKPSAAQRVHARKDQIDYTRPGYNNLVAEIVARDIDRLSRGQPLAG